MESEVLRVRDQGVGEEQAPRQGHSCWAARVTESEPVRLRRFGIASRCMFIVCLYYLSKCFIKGGGFWVQSGLFCSHLKVLKTLVNKYNSTYKINQII